MKRLEFDTSPSTGRPLLLVALVVASLVITTVWYREGTKGPLHAARRVVLAAGSPFAAAGTFLTTPVRVAAAFITDTGVSRSEYLALSKQNEQLKARLALLEEAKAENDRIRELVKFMQAQDYSTVGARVIGRPTDSWERSIVVDRGTADGVKLGAPVIAAGGLVGQVIEVTSASAKVRLITDSGSGVAVLIQRTRAEGVVRGSVDGRLSLDFVAKANAPVKGDVLVTSGTGGAYPKGIVVGEVTDVAAAQADLFPKVGAVTRVPIDRIEEVLVLLGAAPEPQAGANE